MTKQIALLALFLCFSTGSIFSQSRKPSELNNLCNRIAEIKELPVKGVPGRDAAYDAIVAAGELVLPCLIAKITVTIQSP